GLVDAFGGLDDAIAEAARRAKLDPDDVEVAWLEKKPGFADNLLMALATDEDDEDSQAEVRDAFGRIGSGSRFALFRAFADAEKMLTGPAIQVRCLECPPTAG